MARSAAYSRMRSWKRNWPPGARAQQVMIEQGGQRLLRLGQGDPAQRGRGRQADRARMGSSRAAGRTAGARVPASGRTRRRPTSPAGWPHPVARHRASGTVPRPGRAAAAGSRAPACPPPAGWPAAAARTAARPWPPRPRRGPGSAPRPGGTVRPRRPWAARRGSARATPGSPDRVRRVVIRIRLWPDDGQQWLDLVRPGRVVQDHDRAAAAQLGPEQRGALAGGVRDPGGGRGEHPEQPVQRLGRVERRQPGSWVWKLR